MTPVDRLNHYNLQKFEKRNILYKSQKHKEEQWRKNNFTGGYDVEVR